MKLNLNPHDLLHLTLATFLICGGSGCEQKPDSYSLKDAATSCSFANGSGENETGKTAEECARLSKKYGQPMTNGASSSSSVATFGSIRGTADEHKTLGEFKASANGNGSASASVQTGNGQSNSVEAQAGVGGNTANPPSAPVPAPAPAPTPPPAPAAGDVCIVVIDGKTEKANEAKACEDLRAKALAAFKLPPLSL